MRKPWPSPRRATSCLRKHPGSWPGRLPTFLPILQIGTLRAPGLLGGTPTQGEVFGLRIQGLGLHPDWVTCLPCGLEKSLTFPDLGVLGCEMGLAIPALPTPQGHRGMSPTSRDTKKQKGLNQGELCTKTAGFPEAVCPGNGQHVAFRQQICQVSVTPNLLQDQEQEPALTSISILPELVSLGVRGTT